MIGRCKLCLQDGVSLQDSHFLPKGIYKILRDDNENNPNPWMLTSKTAVQTSWQMTAQLLCQDCEKRFNKYSENWVLGHCLKKDGSFPLAAILASRTPDKSLETTTTRIYYASKIPEINIPALAYFAASIFWRGSIRHWNNDGSTPVMLGPFQEQLRQYLMGVEAFPKDCSLWIVVREGKEIGRLTVVPFGGRVDNFHVYNFSMPGFAFSLMVGKNVSASYRKICFVRGHENPIVVTTNIEKFLEKHVVKLGQQRLYKLLS